MSSNRSRVDMDGHMKERKRTLVSVLSMSVVLRRKIDRSEGVREGVMLS